MRADIKAKASSTVQFDDADNYSSHQKITGGYQPPEVVTSSGVYTPSSAVDDDDDDPKARRRREQEELDAMYYAGK